MFRSKRRDAGAKVRDQNNKTKKHEHTKDFDTTLKSASLDHSGIFLVCVGRGLGWGGAGGRPGPNQKNGHYP